MTITLIDIQSLNPALQAAPSEASTRNSEFPGVLREAFFEASGLQRQAVDFTNLISDTAAKIEGAEMAYEGLLRVTWQDYPPAPANDAGLDLAQLSSPLPAIESAPLSPLLGLAPLPQRDTVPDKPLPPGGKILPRPELGPLPPAALEPSRLPPAVITPSQLPPVPSAPGQLPPAVFAPNQLPSAVPAPSQPPLATPSTSQPSKVEFDPSRPPVSSIQPKRAPALAATGNPSASVIPAAASAATDLNSAATLPSAAQKPDLLHQPAGIPPGLIERPNVIPTAPLTHALAETAPAVTATPRQPLAQAAKPLEIATESSAPTVTRESQTAVVPATKPVMVEFAKDSKPAVFSHAPLPSLSDRSKQAESTSRESKVLATAARPTSSNAEVGIESAAPQLVAKPAPPAPPTSVPLRDSPQPPGAQELAPGTQPNPTPPESTTADATLKRVSEPMPPPAIQSGAAASAANAQPATANAAAVNVYMPPAITPLAAPIAMPPQLESLNLLRDAASADWGNGLGERVSWMINQKQNTATLRLDPPALGKLDVQVKITDDATTISIQTQHAQTRDLIETASLRLREFLQDSGYQNVNVDVSHRQDQQQARAPQTIDRSGERADDSEPNTADEASQQRNAPGDGLVDIFA